MTQMETVAGISLPPGNGDQSREKGEHTRPRVWNETPSSFHSGGLRLARYLFFIVPIRKIL